jgi:pyruvate,water dikinase
MKAPTTTVAAGPRCIAIADIAGESAGGKAGGLFDLLRLGFEVPPAFVVVGASPGDLPLDLGDAYAKIGGGKVAVRSSASDEDAGDASFAGQYATLLDVEGLAAVRAAVDHCLQSMHSARADAYREKRTGRGEARMCVIVQRMVDARAAGVTFTADPVSGRRDRIVVDAVRGLGESLVAGQRSADHFFLDPRGRIVAREIESTTSCLDDDAVARIADGALRAAAAVGAPLDLEWAIDESGRLHWLQARPITHLAADVRELDFVKRAGDVFTKCNIGEMMPGAVTPLTWSISARGIDYGMQSMYVALGAQPRIEAEPMYVAMSFGHLFLNLTRLAEAIRYIAGSTPERACMAICGRNVPDVVVRAPAIPSAVRLRNGLKYARLTASGSAHLRRMQRRASALFFDRHPSADATYRAIHARVPDLLACYAHHLVASTAAGALAPTLVEIVARGRAVTERDHALVASWLAGARDVESHDIAAGIDRIVDCIAADPAAAARLASITNDEAAQWLASPAGGSAGEAYAAYLARHGHRAVREIELRQEEWRVDPTPVVASILGAVAARRSGRARLERTPPSARPAPLLLRPLVAFARAGVRTRERSKSLLVSVTTKFKEAYRALAALLVAEGRMPDLDLIFFFLHDELGELARAELARTPPLVQRALARRRALPLQMRLEFPDVWTGAAEPLPTERPTPSARSLSGRPVSPGVVRGVARVAATLAEASQLKAGEILIAPITDVGWTPFFSVIAGLATDIGSAVSHGAVVAREYGLPAVLNLRYATRVFRTGDRVVLDADRGILAFDDEGSPQANGPLATAH